MLYDIVHLEDDKDTRGFVQSAATHRNFIYLGLPCLNALEETLRVHNGRIFVVDGRFPREQDGQVLELAGEAIEMIRATYPSADVVLYSSLRNGQEIANRYKTRFISKNTVLARPMVDELQKVLASAPQ